MTGAAADPPHSVSAEAERGHVALITGASGDGIGRAIAIELASYGVRVVLAARSEVGLNSTSSVVEQSGGVARVEPIDLTDRAAIGAMLRRLDDDGWAVDILVNNAADLTLGDALDCSDETWDRVLDVNLTAPFLLARAIGPSMGERGWGRIVNISSVAGQRAMPRCAAYGVSKAGLDHLTRMLALELAATNVTVNAVTLGPIDTDRMNVAHSAAARDWLRGRVPLRRMGRPTAVAKVVGLLASPDADFITGQVWAVDGGMSIT